jgi:hypothetical protein
MFGANPMSLSNDMKRLVAGIEGEIDSVLGELGEVPEEFDVGLCHRVADDFPIARSRTP